MISLPNIDHIARIADAMTAPAMMAMRRSASTFNF
jgi:hypothetical protein